MRVLAIIFHAILFTSCATQFTVIHEELLGAEGGRGTLIQGIMVTNPPRNWERLVKMMEEYNRQTISYMELREYSIRRSFHRRSWFLRKDFEQGKPYPMLFGDLWSGWDTQHLQNHPFLMRTFHSIDTSGRFFYSVSIPEDRRRIGSKRSYTSYTIDDPKNYFLGE